MTDAPIVSDLAPGPPVRCDGPGCPNAATVAVVYAEDEFHLCDHCKPLPDEGVLRSDGDGVTLDDSGATSTSGQEWHGMAQGVLATLATDANGRRFSEEALQQLAAQLVGTLIVWQFDETKPIGIVASARVEEGKVVIGGNHTWLTADESHWRDGGEFAASMATLMQSSPEPLYYVPGYLMNEWEVEPDGTEVHKDVTVMAVALVLHPSDPTQTPIEIASGEGPTAY